MSVQLLPYTHINALVSFATGPNGIRVPYESALEEQLLSQGCSLPTNQTIMGKDNREALGRLLVAHLAGSYTARYEGKEASQEASDYISEYKYAPAGHSLSLLELARGLDSYAYQASCAFGWQVSSAKQFLDLGRALILRRLMDNDSEATEGWVIEE